MQKKISQAKLEANRRNGRNSTGPKTAEGKAKVSQNALKHGLRSEKNPLDISTQIPGEQTQFTALLADFTTSLQPADAVELQLITRLAQLTLRLNRAATMESAAIDKARADALDWAAQFPDDAPDPATPEFETHILATACSQASNELKLLSQYESRLSRDFARTLTQLRQSQKLRKQTRPAANPLDLNERTGHQVPSCALEEKPTGPPAGDSRERAPLCEVEPIDRSLASNGQIAPIGPIANPRPSDASQDSPQS